jgi:hypothetical protein
LAGGKKVIDGATPSNGFKSMNVTSTGPVVTLAVLTAKAEAVHGAAAVAGVSRVAWYMFQPDDHSTCGPC